jgi:large subunit ribosomal protein L5
MAKQDKAKDKKKDKGGEAAEAQGPAPPPRLWEKFQKEIRSAIGEKLGRKNVMSLPRIQKIVVNMGVGEASAEKKHLDESVDALTQITGQKPLVTKARQSVAGFKLREGMAIGAKVTLRGARMYEFFDRLVTVAAPRIRDFRGLSPRSFDGRGNYSVGFTEQIIFPEINVEKVAKIRGMDVTIVTTAKTDEEGRELLKLMNMPFRQR